MQMQKWAWLAVCGLATVGMMGWAHADSRTDGVTVQGVAHFEKHFTLVPYDLCPGLSQCPQSRPYWALVIDSPTGKYEIDQIFGEGETRAPQLVRLEGKVVRDGTQVRLDGSVEYSSPDYWIIGDVHNVNLVLWYGDDEPNPFAFSNWDCRGYLDRDTAIHVAVWSNGGTEDAGVSHYGLRLIATQEATSGPQSFPLVSLYDARAYADRDTVIYQGADASTNVQLEVHEAATNPPRNHLQAELKFSLGRLPEGVRIPAQSQVEVSCNRIR